MIRNVPSFNMGQIVATRGALLALLSTGEDASNYLDRHSKGDWGDMDPDDWRTNDESLTSGARLFSAYTLWNGKTRIWIITEAVGDDGKRASTTVLIPDEY